MKLGKWFVLGLLALFGGILFARLQGKASVEPESVAVVEAPAPPQSDQEVRQSVLESPEAFDELPVDTQRTGLPKPLTVPTRRPVLLSEIEKPKRVPGQNDSVAAEDLYFWADYVSLRTDAIRNPDSKENRDRVAVLLNMRQRR